MPDAEGEWTFTTRSNRPELNGKIGPLRLRRAVDGQSWPGHGAQDLALRLCGRHAVSAVRHHLLRLDASGRRARRADARHAEAIAVQQDAHVRVPEVVRVQSQRTSRLCVRARCRRRRTTTRASIRSSSGVSKSASRNCSSSGIEADLILFHPYDRWGYSNMGAENDDRYLRYVVARLVGLSQRLVVDGQRMGLREDQDAARLGPLLPHRAGERPVPAPALDPSTAG